MRVRIARGSGQVFYRCFTVGPCCMAFIGLNRLLAKVFAGVPLMRYRVQGVVC